MPLLEDALMGDAQAGGILEGFHSHISGPSQRSLGWISGDSFSSLRFWTLWRM
ncbi:hypothetical protein HKBW3S34_00669 [Candidatus Hakubella thermalkaliphila]|uniref:Uncharacterized protein n=1 Tax=Candidatus Hakubella thermalkaliphila TaxID=2754717 RepID=A0A6V8PAP6_9ACTN|nr:hypothetical protein HKBW3S34_00669 [Candidatus Hakubella thermalkaliphila]